MTCISIFAYNNYANLVCQRPPNYTLFKQIMTGSPDTISRQKYSYAAIWPTTGVLTCPTGGFIYVDNVNDQSYYGMNNSYISISSLLNEDYHINSVQYPNDFYYANPGIDTIFSLPTLLDNGRYVYMPGLSIDWDFMLD